MQEGVKHKCAYRLPQNAEISNGILSMDILKYTPRGICELIFKTVHRTHGFSWFLL